MLNNAWPSLHWNLFGYDLSTNGSTYGAMEANRPLHLQYSYDDNSIVLVNGTAHTARGLRADVATYGLDGRRLSSWSTVTVAAPDNARRLTVIRRPAQARTSAYLVALRLYSPSGRLIDANTYWLSTAPDRIDWRRSTWFVTPTSRYADLRALATMPRVGPGVRACVEAPGRVRVTLGNDSRHIALFLTATLLGREGSIRPAYWSDNDVTLTPGEHRSLTVRYTGDATAVHVSGASWVGGVTVALPNCS
jgi:exo-1,4-beta-D-glucosaminidase